MEESCLNIIWQNRQTQHPLVRITMPVSLLLLKITIGM
jgi:hypothetical protein